MEKLNNLLIVTGISGSGKDYLLSEVVKNNPELASKIPIYSFGQELFKALKEKGVNGDLQNRDQLKEVGDQKLMQLAITQTVNYILTTLPAIINTHIAYKQNNSIQINPNIDRLLRAKEYVFVRTEPDLLKARRELDTSRNRELESVDDINIHQEIALQTAIIIARSIGSSLTIIENREDNLYENIERITNTINLVSKP